MYTVLKRKKGEENGTTAKYDVKSYNKFNIDT